MSVWRPEDIEKLKKLTEELTLPKIAAEMGRDYEEVRYAIRKYGFKTQAEGVRDFKTIAEITRYSDRNGVKKAAEHFKLTKDVVKAIRIRYRRSVERIGDGLSPEAIEKLRGAAMRHASKKGYYEHAQDFASHCVVQRLTHNSVDVSYAWFNFMKETFGDIYTEKGKAENAARFNTSEIVEDEYEDGVKVGVTVAAPDRDTLALARLAADHGITGYNRSVMILYFQFGFSLSEIALVFDEWAGKVGGTVKELVHELKEKGLGE